MLYFVTEKLGPKMSVTPEGFLLCQDVPVARTGMQLYMPSEVPVKPGSDGLVRIHREPEEVFKPESIASYNGKPIVNGHPPQDLFPNGVDLETWKELTVGIILNPRRGEGIWDDAVLADMLFTNEMAIALVHAGKREVSAGYDSKYRDAGDGKGYQTDIIINHVALVEHARCGAQCTIGDEIPEGVSEMKKWLEQLKAAFAAKDETKTKALLENAPAGITVDEAPAGTHLHIHNGGDEGTETAAARTKWDDAAIEKKFEEHGKMIGDNHTKVMDALGEISKKLEPKAEDAAEEKAIEGALKEEAPAGTGDVAQMKDSAPLSDLYTETVSVAEIIAPGIRYATFDSAAKPTKTYSNICALRRKALTLGNNEAATAGMIESANGGRQLTTDSIDKMPCQSVRSLFFAVGSLKRNANNSRSGDNSRRTNDDRRDDQPKRPMSIAEVNKRNSDFYAGVK